METVIQGSTLQTLRAGLRGTAHAPGEEGYEEASRAWNLAALQQPALVVVAGGAADVMAAVRFAREGGLGVGVMATGHGVGAASNGGVLINTSNMRGVRVDPLARTARVEAGALWTDLTHATRPFQTGDTYVNFMELEGASTERVKAAYAPEDFERLVALKDRYDPQNVFRFNRNIAPSKAWH
jgi:FAD/FMN-containing dehydrogenase